MNRILIYAARLGRWVPALALAVAASGCGHSYLHNPTRQKQAEATTQVWSEVDNTALIATERENLNKLLQAEQATQARVAAARRQYLAAVIVAPLAADKDRAAQSVAARLYAKAQQELAALVGPLEAYDKQVAAADQARPIRADVDEAAQRLKALGSPVSDCVARGGDAALPPSASQWLATLDKTVRTGANDDLRTLRTECARLAALGARDDQALGPVLRAALDDRNADRLDLGAKRKAFESARQRYDSALKDYQAAEAAAQKAPADATLAARLGAAATTLGAQIDALRGLNNALAQEFIAGETLDSIDSALAAIAAGDAGDDTRKGVVFALQAPALIDRYRAAIADSKKPLALPLLIRRNAEKLQRDAAATDVRLLEAKLALSERIVAAVQAQAAALRRALRELDRARALDSVDSAGAAKANLFDRQLSWPEALDATDGPTRQMLLSGAARYLDAMSRLEGERYRLAYARIATDHERGLAYAETSVAQWANLIGAGVGQLDAFGKGGIDGAVLSDLAKVLGLFWIGRGVNQ